MILLQSEIEFFSVIINKKLEMYLQVDLKILENVQNDFILESVWWTTGSAVESMKHGHTVSGLCVV